MKSFYFKNRNKFKQVENYLIKGDNCIKVSNGGARNNSDMLKFSKILDFHTVIRSIKIWNGNV